METGYQRGRIQDESHLYETRKHDGTLPIVGVNTFVAADSGARPVVELRRSDEAEKRARLDHLHAFKAAHAHEREAALDRVRVAACDRGNTFAALMHAVRSCTLGEITATLYELGGRYRRGV
jgi:methylmalonyl-CoA mutase